MNVFVIVAISALIAAILSIALTILVSRNRHSGILSAKEEQINRLNSELEVTKALRVKEAEQHEKNLETLREGYQKSLDDLKENNEKSIAALKESQDKAIASTKTELALENEKILKQREEAVKQQAQEMMRTITGDLNKDIKEMKDSFDAQKKAVAEDGSATRTKFEETVKNLKAQTEAIGNQAVDLANALKGQNKMQGIFGEAILARLLEAEGLVKGQQYDSEDYLRDEKGNIIRNEDTDKKMRPDFVLHFPENIDVLLDSKVSLSALSDYFAAKDDAEREDAAERNLLSVKAHVKELADKNYQKYVKNAKTLDFVIMFIPNYGAYQLAKLKEPGIFAWAFNQNVLITTEETLVPFLRMIRTAWVNKGQIENVQKIIDGAQKMIDRVALFYQENCKIQEDLEKSVSKMKKNTERLIGGRQSILKAAIEVTKCGVNPSKGNNLPKIIDLGNDGECLIDEDKSESES